MEEFGNCDNETVIGVLIQGRDVANELKNHLHPTISSIEVCDILLESVLSSYENALKLLDYMSQPKNGEVSQISVANTIENSLTTSEGSHQNSKDHQIHKSKKRKTLPKWSEHVRVSSETGFEVQLGDGYNWRKYGQKDILGANHPRAYYRCTHQKTQGCLARKHIQRADEDPSIFEVVYSGKHSCMQERTKQKKENVIVLKKEEQQQEEGLKPKNQETETNNDYLQSFSFPSTPIESENFETRLFSDSGNFAGGATPFMSPATSESYFSQCPANDFGVCLQSSESDFGEIISNPTNFAFGDLDYLIDQVDFDSHFFDAPDYF